MAAAGVAACAWTGAAMAVEFPERPGVMLNAAEIAVLRAQLGFGSAQGAGSPLDWKIAVYRDQPVASLMQGPRGVRANAELWLGRDIEIPARGGHYHHFFCDDGDRLEIPPDQRFAPGPYKCTKCGREYSGARYEAAVRRFLHGWLSHAAWSLAVVSVIEDRPECAAKSAEILTKYAEAYPGPHTGKTEGGMVFQSLDESMWVIPLAQAYDLVYATLGSEQRTRIETFLRTVAEGIRKCGTGGNWGSWHLSAAGVVGFAVHDAGLVAWSLDEFRRQIRDELGDDGLWPESVHTYHFFPLLAFMHLAEAAGHAGVDLYRWEAKPGKSLLSMFTAPLDYAYPDFRLPAINDGWFEAFLPPDCYELAYHRTRLPQFARVIASAYNRGAPAGSVSSSTGPRRAGLYAFLYGDEVSADVETPVRRSVDFPGLGICMLRSANGAMMSFDYGPYLGHGQFDKMGVTLFADNRLWMADYGTPGYGATILPWYTSTFAHNTVVVDGRSQQRTKERAAELWLGGEEIEAVRSSTTQAYPGVTHTRTVIRTPDYFVVLDDLISDSDHTYDLYWHGEGELRLDDTEPNPSAVDGLDARITAPGIAPGRANLGCAWDRGDSSFAVAISADAEFTPIVAECPAETGARRVPLLICRREAKTASFATVLMPVRGRHVVRLQRSDRELTISSPGFTDTITLPQSGQPPAIDRRR